MLLRKNKILKYTQKASWSPAGPNCSDQTPCCMHLAQCPILFLSHKGYSTVDKELKATVDKKQVKK